MIEQSKRQPRPQFIENPTFYQWLATRRADDDTTGQFARFAKADIPCWPRKAESVTEVLDHLNEHHRAKNMDEITVRHIWRRYARFLSKGEPIRVKSGPDPLPPDQRRIHRGFLVDPKTVIRVQAISGDTGESIGKVVDRVITAEHRKRRLPDLVMA
jgi:uncharacterized protein YozE (UPF0346 family)